MIPQWAIDDYKTITEIDQSNNSFMLGGLILISMEKCDDDLCKGTLTFKISPDKRIYFAYFHNRDGCKACETLDRFITPDTISSTSFLKNIDLYKQQLEILEKECINGLVFNITASY